MDQKGQMNMAVAALIPLLTPVVEQLIAHIPDPGKRDKARMEAEATLLSLLGQQQLGQVEINKQEAANAHLFVAGWRPFIGWVCGVGLGYTYVVAPIWAWWLTLYYPSSSMPVLPTDNLFELVLAMLGLGGLRTFEKLKGVSK
jgi:hypothetical protein